MLKHALFSAPEGVLSSFCSLATIDYGGNVPRAEEFDPMFHNFDKNEWLPSL